MSKEVKEKRGCLVVWVLGDGREVKREKVGNVRIGLGDVMERMEDGLGMSVGLCGKVMREENVGKEDHEEVVRVEVMKEMGMIGVKRNEKVMEVRVVWKM